MSEVAATGEGTIGEYPLVILERHLDTFGHVNNAVYLEIFEEARWAQIAPRGFGIPEVQAKGQGPTVLELRVRFLKELRLRERVTVKSQVLAYERKVFRLRQWIENAAGETACEAEFTMALFDLRARKLIPPTPEFRAAIGL